MEAIMKLVKLDPYATMRIALCATVLLGAAAIAACATPTGRAEPVEATPPSVTYKYSDEQGLIDASLKAETYCRDFNSWPTSTGVHVEQDGARRVTFVCDQDRTETYAGARHRSMPPNPTVQYTYRDERGLIEATTQAQQHCASFGAEARSTKVSRNSGGTRTVEFECVRTP
jgi:hypothetical protein